MGGEGHLERTLNVGTAGLIYFYAIPNGRRAWNGRWVPYWDDDERLPFYGRLLVLALPSIFPASKRHALF